MELSAEDLADEGMLDELARIQMEEGIIADESLPEELDRNVLEGAAATPEAAPAFDEAADLKKKQEDLARKAADAAKAEDERNKRAQELEASGKKAAGGLHKFDASEVDVHGGNATADDFMDAFGFDGVDGEEITEEDGALEAAPEAAPEAVAAEAAPEAVAAEAAGGALLSLAELEELQAECMADDIAIEERMLRWTKEEVRMRPVREGRRGVVLVG